MFDSQIPLLHDHLNQLATGAIILSSPHEYNLITYGRKVSKLDLLDKFNRLGAEGRELVAGYGVETKGVGSESGEIAAIFKRANA